MSIPQTDRPHVFIGLVCIAPMFFTILLLMFFPAEGTFLALMFFIVIFIVAAFGAYMVKDQRLNHEGIPFFSKEDAHEGGTQDLLKQKESFDRWDLVLIPAGFGALVLLAIIITPIGGPITSLIVGGGLLIWLLLKSESIVVPWMVHAAYNIFVQVASTFSLVPGFTLEASPIFVPTFNFDEFVPADIIVQSFMQIFGVALMEETMRVSVAMGIALFLPIGRFGALGLSTIGWVIAHTIISYR